MNRDEELEAASVASVFNQFGKDMGEQMVSEWRGGSREGYFNFSEHGVGEKWRKVIL